MRADHVVLAQGRRPGGTSLPWLVHGTSALPLRRWRGRLPFADIGSVTGLLAAWSAHAAALRELTTSAGTAQAIDADGIDVRSLELEAPVRPGQLFCTIGNYRRQVIQAAEDAARGTGDASTGDASIGQARSDAEAAVALRRSRGAPYVCLTSTARVTGPTAAVPAGDPTLDWEVEIAAVLGAGGRPADPRAADGLIAGYCTANDLTVRARVTRPDVPALGSDWLQSKGGPGTLPLGPWFVPAWQVGDVAALRLRLWVNGELMQDDLAQDMIFPVGEQVAYLARHTAVAPGDVICTGSPAGFGAHYGRYLRPGDLVAAEVSGLGRQEISVEHPREELAS
jgi:2-keto-4-pentenoate hydratase/2-oxohepta-3-ene-1,7-dioic acid hydratase in catechol pathway